MKPAKSIALYAFLAAGCTEYRPHQICEEVEENQIPEIVSDPPDPFELTLAIPSNFIPQQVFISSSLRDEVRVYNSSDLSFFDAFTHPSFQEIPSDSHVYGPNGIAFNQRGHLVVAGYREFVEFSDYGITYATYPKWPEEATENLVFDRHGNLYTTTSTGGSDQLNQYRALDYAFQQTITLPSGAGQLTGITFDDYDRLYVASQSDDTIYVAVADPTFTSFTWIDTYNGDNKQKLEGLQMNSTGELVVAAGEMALYDVSTGERAHSFNAPGNTYPVPVRVDNEGFIYTADYENGSGTASADIFKFSPDGNTFITVNDPDLLGPFGAAISGTVLAGDAPVEFVYKIVATDPNDDTLTFHLVQGPEGLTLDMDTGELSWWVTSVDIGWHPITVEVRDVHGGLDRQEFTLQIVGN